MSSLSEFFPGWRAVAKHCRGIYAVVVFGFLNIRKPAGPTSHDIVAGIRRMASPGTGQKRRDRIKAGHAGTLDPFAEGVLVICLGQATRLAEFVQAQPKRYTAGITLGFDSTTDDIEGEISPSPAPPRQPDEQAIRRALEKFTGCIQQTPPAHSAVHIAGQRAYKLARAGVDVEMPAREVNVFEINLLSYEYPLLEIDVRCGSGTYIRSLARDVGAELGVGGYCSKLIRTAVGRFILSKAHLPDEVNPQRDLIKPQNEINLPIVIAGAKDVASLCQGKKISAELIAPLGRAAELVAVADAADRLIALVAPVETEGQLLLKPVKVFPPKA